MPKSSKKRENKRVMATSNSTYDAIVADVNHHADNGDMASELSVVDSDSTSLVDAGISEPTDGDVEQDQLDDNSAQQVFLATLRELFEQIEEKSGTSKLKALAKLVAELSSHYVDSDFMENHRMSVLESLHRSMKRGKPEEQRLAAQCIGVLFLQCADSDIIERSFREISPILVHIATDPSANPQMRSTFAIVYSLCSFIGVYDDPLTVKDCMDHLESIFKAAYHKGDGTSRKTGTDMYNLWASALLGWTFLLTLLPSSMFSSLFDAYVPKLQEIFDTTDLHLRLTAGQTLAVLFESAHAQEIHVKNFSNTCSSIADFANEGGKQQSKVANKEQRSTFRDILETVRHGTTRETLKRISNKEELSLVGWREKIWYEVLCRVLGTGIRRHLASNGFVRNMFDLGAPLASDAATQELARNDKRRLYSIVKSDRKIARANKRKQKDDVRKVYADGED